MLIMRKFYYLSLALLCLTLSTPAWSADDSTAEQDKQAKKAGPKKSKPAKSETTGSGSSSTLDSELDKFLSKPTPKGSPQPPDDSAPKVNDRAPSPPPSSSTPSEDSSSPPASSGTTSAPTTSDQSNNSDSDSVTIDEQKIPANTLQAGEFNNEAVTALNNKQFQKAIDLLHQALAVDPNYTQGKSNLRVAYYNYALNLYDNEKYSEALPFFQKALDLSKQLGKDDTDIRKYYADCQKSANQQSKH
jgi:tetratricopeptide (TPR) repeat protein